LNRVNTGVRAVSIQWLYSLQSLCNKANPAHVDNPIVLYNKNTHTHTHTHTQHHGCAYISHFVNIHAFIVAHTFAFTSIENYNHVFHHVLATNQYLIANCNLIDTLTIYIDLIEMYAVRCYTCTHAHTDTHTQTDIDSSNE